MVRKTTNAVRWRQRPLASPCRAVDWTSYATVKTLLTLVNQNILHLSYNQESYCTSWNASVLINGSLKCTFTVDSFVLVTKVISTSSPAYHTQAQTSLIGCIWHVVCKPWAYCGMQSLTVSASSGGCRTIPLASLSICPLHLKNGLK